MKYQLVKKDGTTQIIEAQTWRRQKPMYEFVNFVIKGGRRVDDVVLSVPITDVTTIQKID